METDTTTEGAVDTTNNEGEQSEVETISIPKSDYEKLNQTLGSLKREVKDLKKPKDEPKEDSKESQKESPDYSLIEKTFFKASGINDPDVMQLAKDFAKRTGDSLDVVLEDDIFKARAEKLLTTKANSTAVNVKTNRSNTTTGRNSVEYWIAKGEHPPRELGREIAEKYVEAKRNQGKNAKVFYND